MCPTTKEEKEGMTKVPYSSAIESFMYAMVCKRLDISHAVGIVKWILRGAISWQSKLQKCVALSATEVEYIVDTEAGKKMVWLKLFLQELGLHQKEYVVHCDSQSTIDLNKNIMYHAMTKHIDVKYHWIRENIEDRSMQVMKIPTSENHSNMLTKVVSRDKFELCKELVSMHSS
ncbi:hypothetical protein KY284_011067 [Solanum tuberosum]|nr:hypothetical protein KY284_011067 [Solanum tuberosum]